MCSHLHNVQTGIPLSTEPLYSVTITREHHHMETQK